MKPLRIGAGNVRWRCVGWFWTALALAGAPSDSRADQVRGGEYAYVSASSCVAAGKLPADLCANAQANAAAEFSEKALRFPDRALCERAFAAGCELGFAGADGLRGKRSSVYFTPRQEGFRIVVRSGLDMVVTPVAKGLSFFPRSILRRDTRVAYNSARAARQARDPYAGGAGSVGDSLPGGVRGPLPPPAPVDPDFDCDSYLEPSARGDPNPRCYPAPGGRR